MKYWFTGDEHLWHKNANRLFRRPFKDFNDMINSFVENHNYVVREEDIVIHTGDLSFASKNTTTEQYIRRLKGQHIFLRGNHDYWMESDHYPQIWEKKIKGHYVVACHYSMRVWPRSHYGSFLLFGHSHGKLEPLGKQHDVGVDNNYYFPVSFDKIIEIMETRDENPNMIIRE